MREGVMSSSLWTRFFPSPLVGEGGASRSEATGEGYLTARQALQGYPPIRKRAAVARRCSCNALSRNPPRKLRHHELRHVEIRRLDCRQSRSQVTCRRRLSL